MSLIRLRSIIEDVDEEMKEDQIAAVRKPAISMMQLKFCAITMKALIDTEVQISVVTKVLYNKLVHAGIEMKVISIKRFKLMGAFSEKGA